MLCCIGSGAGAGSWQPGGSGCSSNCSMLARLALALRLWAQPSYTFCTTGSRRWAPSARAPSNGNARATPC